MKNKPSDYFRISWQVVTEVPGWPDAPLHARVTRSLPIIFPLIAIALIVTWSIGYFTPRANAEKALLQPMLSLEAEISSLQMMSSQQQLADLAESKVAASRLLIGGPDELPSLLQELKATIHKAEWDVSFQIAEISEETAGAEPMQVTYLPVRAKFKPQANNQERFASLLSVLERLSSSGKRIDLTRVAIRADETRWQAVEVNFRLICPVVDAKTL